MNCVNQWVALDHVADRYAFMLHHFSSLTLDEEVEDIIGHFSYQVKSRANQLLPTAQRDRALELSDSLLYLAIVLPLTLPRTRLLAWARGLLIRANFLFSNGDYVRAELDYAESLRLCREANSPIEVIRCQMRQIEVLARLGRYTEAFDLVEPTLQLAEESGDRQLLVDVLSNVGCAYIDREEYRKAEKTFHRMLSLLTGADQEELGVCYRGLAESNLHLNHYADALEMAERGKAVSEALGQELLVAMSERMIASAHFWLGHFTKALRAWDDALYLFQRKQCHWEAFLVNAWRCTCLVQLNRLDEAFELCDNLLAEAQEQGWLNFVAEAHYLKALIQTRLGLTAEALESYREASRLYLPNLLTRLYLNQAELLLKLGDYEQAREVLQRAEEHCIAQQTQRWLTQARLLAARLFYAEHDFNRATEIGQEARQLAEQYDLPFLNYQVWQLHGEVAEAQGQTADALDYYEKAIANLERLRSAVSLELRGDFVRDKTQVYEAAVCLALDQGDLGRAYDYIERSKSRSLTELIVNQVDLQVRARSAGDLPLVEQLNSLRAQYAEYYQRLNSDSQLVPAELEAARVGLRSCEKKFEQLRWQLQIRNSDYAEEFSLAAIGSDSPRPWLDSETLLIEYYIARDEVLALTTSAAEQRVYRKLVDAATLETSLKTLPMALQNIPPHLAPKFLRNTQARLGALYRQLFAPLAEQAARFHRLIFVPHGALHYLPFQALWNSRSGRYLVEDFEVSYLPAASQLGLYRRRAAELRQEGQSANLVLGYSGEDAKALPHVPEEASAVADCLGRATRLYLGTDARLEALQNLDEAYRVIHLATHGEFRADAPLFSFLDLADGKLLTVDLFNLKLRAGIITLSACESGLNVITGGDELVGLSRACLYAGAASLLLSLWQVEDRSTSGLMREFYGRLASPGATRASALREAQLALLHGGTDDYRHPYFWAAFCLIGEPGEL